MPGSPTALGLTGARDSAPVRIAFRQENGVGAQNKADFAAQWLAYAIPCRRFAGILANACARLGADVVCYSFIAVDFHHLLLAGLPAHSLLGLLRWFWSAFSVHNKVSNSFACIGSWLRENVYGRKIARIFFLGQPGMRFIGTLSGTQTVA
jgi:hypothetical protein